MLPVLTASGCQHADDFSEHAAVDPELSPVSNGAADCRPRRDRVYAAKDGLTHRVFWPVPIGMGLNDGFGIDGQDTLLDYVDLELADIGGRKTLRRDIADFDSVKVDQLQPPHANGCELQGDLAANRSYADHGRCQNVEPHSWDKFLLAFKSAVH
jgi:hypothetical protein